MVDALGFTSIPCILFLQDKELRKVMHHFDTLTKKESGLEKIVQTMGEIANEDEQEMEKDPSLQMKKQPLQIKTIYFYLMTLMSSGVST